MDALAFATRLLHPRHVVLVTCCGRDGRANVVTLAWSMPTSFRPPMVALSIAPERFSHRLIEETGEFVVNVPTVELLSKVYFAGTKSGRDVDKLKEAGFAVKPARRVRPPVIEECIAHLECRVVHRVATGDHTLFVGEVVAAYADEEAFKGKVLDPRVAKPLLHYGIDRFTTVVDEVLKPA
ncbi:MAG: flavin reductase family protein [Candidatus Nezhaarchaeota archaeon]|nr:flavin reductase family protein [Candidatus Nezhaarchaeota archaeon]